MHRSNAIKGNQINEIKWYPMKSNRIKGNRINSINIKWTYKNYRKMWIKWDFLRKMWTRFHEPLQSPLETKMTNMYKHEIWRYSCLIIGSSKTVTYLLYYTIYYLLLKNDDSLLLQSCRPTNLEFFHKNEKFQCCCHSFENAISDR